MKREAVPSLNVSELGRAGALVPGRIGDLHWIRDDAPVAGIRLQAGKSRLTLSYRFHSSTGASEEVREIVRIVRRRSLSGERKTFFLCPGRHGSPCGRRVANLYGVGRDFLCHHCMRSTVSSRREGRRDRRIVQPHRIRAAAALTGFSAAVASVQALAGGFMVRENSAEGVATVYAGNGSRAELPSTAFNNPAGMTRLVGNEVELGSAVIFPSIEFDGGASVLGAPLSGNHGGDAGRVAVVPNLYWVFGLTDRLKAGLAVTAPFGNSLEYDSNWYGRYLGVKVAAFSADINPNLAYRVSDRLSLAAGLSAQYLKLDYSSAIAQFVIFGEGTPDGLYRFKADSWAFGFNLGALLELEGGTRIGLTYRSGTNHHIEGSLDFTGTHPFLGLMSGSAAAEVHLPSTLGVSFTSDVNPNLSFSADVQWTNWSVFERVVIESQNPPFPLEQGYRDSWMVSIGGVYRLTEAFTLRAGLGWDQTPVTDRFRAVTLPDEDRYLVGIGFGYRVTDSIAVDGGYQHSFAAKHADMNNSLNNTDPITHAVVLAGNYNVAVDILALALRFKY